MSICSRHTSICYTFWTTTTSWLTTTILNFQTLTLIQLGYFYTRLQSKNVKLLRRGISDSVISRTKFQQLYPCFREANFLLHKPTSHNALFHRKFKKAAGKPELQENLHVPDQELNSKWPTFLTFVDYQITATKFYTALLLCICKFNMAATKPEAVLTLAAYAR